MLEQRDTEAIYRIFSDPEVTRYWGKPTMTEPGEAEWFIEESLEGFRDRDMLQWGITETASGRLIGTCTYASWDRVHRRAEIGFALHREEWGKGYMKELLPAFIRFGFEELELHRIEADVDPNNRPAIALLERNGFTEEGILRERYRMNGELQDAVIYGLLHNEFIFDEADR